MIHDEVVTPVGVGQNNILQHVARLVQKDEEQNQRPLRNLAREWNFPKGSAVNQGENSFFDLMVADPKNSPVAQTDDASWVDVVSIAPSRHFIDLVRRPRAFVTAANPAMLSSQLAGIHAGQALVAISLNRASDAEKFGDLCQALMNGTLPLGPSGEIVKGKLLITDFGNVLPEAARESGDHAAWLGRVVWLVSGNAGPQPPPQHADEGNVVRLPFVANRFALAVGRIFANRMNSRRPQQLIYEIDFAKNQTRWMAFLQSMESRLPGISGTARHLLASLEFGLRRIVAAEEKPEGFKYSLKSVEALAQLLVERMANARAAILFSAEEAQKRRWKQRILTKLSEGGLDLRSIYHPLHLTAADCEANLLELETEDLVKRRGKKWECVQGATLPGNRYQTLQMEV